MYPVSQLVSKNDGWLLLTCQLGMVPLMLTSNEDSICNIVTVTLQVKHIAVPDTKRHLIEAIAILGFFRRSIV